ncbi:basic helix-loop-helix transcription factor [Lithospermum erythrorhizon]|uniref:Basic helix-loop-helix transcription factor n=1 Tax=Lithospermum erythrorhizon TaxID=34254 RepID=A0AAV3RSQ9_LITER
MEAEIIDSVAARKIQKADREKLRRGRLNEHFSELGSRLDPDRPKNDKASILTDTIQMLKDLTAEVTRLKAEHTALTEESRELSQEKNDLREEKSSLKSDIESLHGEYQQRMRSMNPWMDHSMVMHPPYTYSLPMPVATGPMPMHQSMQAYQFVPNLCPTFVPFMAPTPLIEQPPTPHESSVMQIGDASHVSSKQNPRYKSSDQGNSISEKTEDSSPVATDLELKTPGSTSEQDLPPGQRKGKKLFRKDKSSTNDSSSSKCSSSPHSVQDVSSNSVLGGTRTDN